MGKHRTRALWQIFNTHPKGRRESVGVFRLRDRFASRNSHSAQDDRELKIL
jgi:hypothetical protein